MGKSQFVDKLTLLLEALEKDLQESKEYFSSAGDKEAQAKMIEEKCRDELFAQNAFIHGLSDKRKAILLSIVYQVLLGLASSQDNNSTAVLLARSFLDGFINDAKKLFPGRSDGELAGLVAQSYVTPTLVSDDDAAFLNTQHYGPEQ